MTKNSVNENYLKDLKDEFEVNAYVECFRRNEKKEILERFLNRKK